MVSKNLIVKAESLKKSLHSLERAIKKTEIIVTQLGSDEYDEIACLALIQSLEMSVESLWKFLRLVLQEVHAAEVVASPKGVINQALTFGLISPSEFKKLIVIIDNRNLMAHTYDQTEAHAITQLVPEYAQFLRTIADRLIQLSVPIVTS